MLLYIKARLIKKSMANIFISHAGEDDQVVDLFLKRLDSFNLGLSAWVEHNDHIPGKEYPLYIYKSISECDVFVLFISESSNAKINDSSNELSYELRDAVKKKKLIVPVLLGDVQEFSPLIMHYLSTTDMIRFEDSERFYQAFGESLMNVFDIKKEEYLRRVDNSFKNIAENKKIKVASKAKKKRTAIIAILSFVAVVITFLAVFIPIMHANNLKSFENIKENIVSIKLYNDKSFLNEVTGFVIDDKGTVVTCLEPFENSNRLIVTDKKGNKAEISDNIEYSIQNDLAYINTSLKHDISFENAKKVNANETLTILFRESMYGNNEIHGKVKETSVKFVGASCFSILIQNDVNFGIYGGVVVNDLGQFVGIASHNYHGTSGSTIYAFTAETILNSDKKSSSFANLKVSSEMKNHALKELIKTVMVNYDSSTDDCLYQINAHKAAKDYASDIGVTIENYIYNGNDNFFLSRNNNDGTLFETLNFLFHSGDSHVFRYTLYDKENDLNFTVEATVNPATFINKPVINVSSAICDKLDLTDASNKNVLNAVLSMCTNDALITLEASELALNEIAKKTKNIVSLMNLGFVFI